MAIDWKALGRDKRLWAVAGVGGAAGVGVAVYRRRHGPASPATGTDQAALSSAPYASMQPSVYDSSLQDIYEGFNQTSLDLQRQITDIQAQLDQTTPPSSTPAPTPTPKPAPKPLPKPTPVKRYITTSRLGGTGGHPVSYAYLQGLGVIRNLGGKWVATGKAGLPKGHQVSYAYLAGSGLIRAA